MFTGKRRGVIGFMLTMAVGIALGAAALVVSNEMARENKDGKTVNPVVTGPSSPASVEKAFEEYQKAYKDYQQAVGLGREDLKRFSDAFKEAKRKLEIEIFRNTPGVAEMDISGLTEASATVPAGSGASAPLMQFSETTVSPFGEGEIVIGSQPSAAVSSVSASDSSISGMDYYQVKAGDSLAKICQKYYGNEGMWQHIVKYQISSIAATPNLIFPGQLIALPRGLTPGAGESLAGTKTTNSVPAAGNVAGNYPPASAGDESWQTSFQKDYLISDNALTNSNTMTVQQIQRFLDGKNSVLAKPYRGSTPAQMIFNAAKKYGINPQVLLARLQCEQGMISSTSASQHQLDWALGVGCYDSGDWNQNFKGLDKQIEFAAHTYRRHYDAARAMLDKGETVTMNIDGQQIKVKNAASYAFYKYCPHFQGNKLFYDVWRGYKSQF